MASLTVALLQLAPAADPLLRGERACRQAAAGGADVALLPELWQTGYDLSTPDGWPDLATSAGGPFVERFAELARELRMAIVVTYLERGAAGPRDAATLVDRDGRRVLHYAKVHTCDWTAERALQPGTAFPVATLQTAAGAVAVGLMICFDREHPEAARALMVAGAELILVPNACHLDGERLGQLRARAFENMTAIAVANYARRPDGLPGPGNGRSMAFDGVCFLPDGTPRDHEIAAGGEEEAIVLAELDLDRLRAYRAREPWGDAYRRPDAYGGLLGGGGAGARR